MMKPLLRMAFRPLDGAYFLAQAVVNGLGFQTLGREAPPVRMTSEGPVATLPEAPGRWPALEIPLPVGALFHASAESMLQRAALWMVPGSLDDAEEFLRARLGRYTAGAHDTWRGSTHIFYVEPLDPSPAWADIVGSVNVLCNEHGAVLMGVRQERGPSRRTQRRMREARGG